MPVARQLDGYFDTELCHLDLVELRDLEFLPSTGGQDREPVQCELVLVIAAGDEAVHGNRAQARSKQATTRQLLTIIIIILFWRFPLFVTLTELVVQRKR